MLPAPNRTTIISLALSQAYDDSMAIVVHAHGQASGYISAYWWELHRIWAGNLWRAKYDEGQKMLWLEEILAEPWGPSRGDFYAVMGAIERLQRLQQTEDEIRLKLGRLTTALKGDLSKLFKDNGKGPLRPEIAEQIAAGGETESQFVNRVFELQPDKQRAAIRQLTDKEQIYATRDWQYDELNGRLLIGVRWETEADGLWMTGTLEIRFTETTEPKRGKTFGFLPERISRWLTDDVLHLKKP